MPAKVTRAVEHHLPNTPVVMVHNTLTFPRPNIYSVGADEVAGIQSCVDYLTSRGRRQMLLVINENRVSGALIRSAFESAVKRYPHVHSTVYTGVPVSVDGGESFALRMLREQPDTDSIICANDLIAIGVLNILKEQGIQVPQQISLMGENNSSFCETCRPRLTSLDTMVSMSSIMAARTLLDVLEGREPSHHVTLQMTIVERGTT